jgi:hypothetical protein
MSSSLLELTKSLASFSGAASLFGLDQIGQVLDVRSPRPTSDEVAQRIDSVTRSMAARLDGRLAATFARADDFQRAVVDFTAALLTLDPSGMLASSGPFLGPVASVLDPVIAAIGRAVPGAEAEVRWSELRNKIEIYALVADVESRIGVSPVQRKPLPELVSRSYELGPFLALWAVEGIGHVYGDQALQDTSTPSGLLSGREGDAAGPNAQLMLHAGIGLAFAQSLLAGLTLANAPDRLPDIIPRFVSLCRENSRPGYVGAAYESLGLVTRTFHQDLIGDVDRELQRSAGDLIGYFWHGVGRAIYFAPRNFLPCAEIDWSGIQSLAPHEVGRLNITAGLAWAVTLVNMRQPAIMEQVLRRHADELSRTPAFANGVASSVLMRTETTPAAPFIAAFVEHLPDAKDPGLPRAWELLVRGPVESALQYHYEKLKQQGRFGEIFRFPTVTSSTA